MLPILKFSVLNYPVRIPMYNLMIGIGLILGLIVFEHISLKNRLKKSEIDSLTVVILISLLSGFVSAAIFDKFVHYHNIKDIVSHLLVFTGLTFAGGLLGGLIAFFISYKLVLKNFHRIGNHLNCVVPAVLIAHCMGRIGCFFGGCCFGKPTNSIIGVNFPVGSLAYNVYGNVKVLPTELIEASFLFVLFLIFYFWVKKNLFEYYLIFYGAFRFIIEFFRGDDRGCLFQTVFSPSQCLSAIMFFTGMILLFFNFKQKITFSHISRP